MKDTDCISIHTALDQVVLYNLARHLVLNFIMAEAPVVILLLNGSPIALFASEVGWYDTRSTPHRTGAIAFRTSPRLRGVEMIGLGRKVVAPGYVYLQISGMQGIYCAQE